MIDEDDSPSPELLRRAALVQGSCEALEHLRHNFNQRTRLTLASSKSLNDFAA